MNETVVTLASISNGAALELFEREFKRVLENIADPNTSPKTAREVSIKVTVRPDENRQIGYTSLEVKSKLAGVKPVAAVVYFGRRKENNELVAVSNDPAQPSIFDNAPSNVLPLRAVPPNGGVA